VGGILRAVEDQSGLPLGEDTIELGWNMYIHRRVLIDSLCISAVRLRRWEGHGA